MAEYPPLGKSFVLSYSNNDRDFPIVAIRKDPRVDNYRIPEDLSPHPDSKRWPNHVFTGAQPTNSDERVQWIYEILPSPWVPFTRYDDDLGPVQGRRRSVKNEGQVASLNADKRTTYEAREGSAIVYTELEETWSIKTDEDGNSLFPIRDRDFYDASRGPVQERRQLFVPTGEEAGSLENVNGVITQTSYEPYNEFLSVKIVQTYKVDGPQLIGKATDNDGQLVTVTTQRKGALDYIPPNPTATRTVEVSREDAESLVERIVDTPEVFKANTFSVERPDPIPQKFRVAVPIQSSQEIVEGTAEIPTLEEGEISKSEEQRNKFIKRISSTSRDQAVLPQTLTGKTTNNERQEVTVTETLQLGNTNEVPTATTTIESEALGDGNYVITKTEVDQVFAGESYQKTKADLTPQKFRAAQEDLVFEETIEGQAEEPSLSEDEFAKTEQQINKFVKRVSTTTRSIEETTQLSEKVLTPQGQIGTRTLTLSKGSQTLTPSATLIDANVEALGDGRTIKTEVIVPDVFAAKTISKTKADLTPQKFRSAQEDTTIEETLAGKVTEPSLAENEFSKSEQQVTEFVKRVTTNVRDIETSTSLEEKVVTPDGQLATRTLRLSKEPQTIDPDELTVDGSIEALGDGRTIKTETRAPSVLELPVFSIERPDATPAKFRVAAPTTTEQKTIVGDAEQPSLERGEISKSEQQQTKFVKRTIVTKRDQDQLPKTITQKTTTNEGLLANVTETLKSGDATEQPNATRTVESEALGDGNYVVRITEVPKVFAGKTFSVEKPDIVPQKFRTLVESVTEQETIEGEAEQPSLSSGDIAKSEQQVTEFIKRVSTTSRDENKLPVTLIQKATNQEKQFVTITETLQQGNVTEQPTARVDIQSEAIGDGKYIVTKTEAPEVFKAQTFRAEKADLTPPKFRAKQFDLTTEENFEGTAAQPTLGEDEFLKSEQQINKFVKRVVTNTRTTALSENLSESVITPEGQLATRTITLSKSAQTLVPSATVIDGEVEELGDGRTVKTEIKVEKPFDAKQESLEKPEVVPTEFRASFPNKTISEIKAGGSVEIPSLDQNELSKTIQRITEHKIRETRIIRPSTDYPPLSGQLVDNDLIKVTRTRTIAKGGQSITPSATVSGTVEALGDGFTLKTEDVKALVFDAKQKTFSQPIQIPAKFLTGKVTENSNIEEGKDADPDDLGTDGFGIIRSSSQRVNEFTVRKTTTEQEGITLLTEKQLNNEGQEVTVESSILDSSEVESGPTIEFARSQSIGGGKFIREIGRVENIFDAKQKTKRQAVQVPAKFLNGGQEQESFIEEGADADPNALGDGGKGVIESTAQRITEHKVRKSIVSQQILNSIIESQTNNAKQKVTVTSSIVDDPQTEPSATTEFVRTQAIGGGKYVKEEGKVDVVFDSLTKSAQKPDTVPEKFRVNSPVKRTEEVIEQTTVEDQSLDQNEYSKTEQRLTEFTVQKTTITREDTFNEVSGKRLEENWGIEIPYKEYIASSIPSGDNSEADGLDDKNHLVREYNKEDLDATLGSFRVTIPSSIDLDLPKVLKNVKVNWQKETSTSVENFRNDPIRGEFTSISQQDLGSVSSSLTLIPSFEIQMEDIWGKNLPATISLFFLKKENLTKEQIRSKAGANKDWPVFKPQSFSTTVFGKSETLQAEGNVSRTIQINNTEAGYGYTSSSSDRTKTDLRLIPVSIDIPPFLLEEEIEIEESEELQSNNGAPLFTELTYQGGTITTANEPPETVNIPSITVIASVEKSLNCNVSFTIQKTSNFIPKSGTYLISSSAEPYKFGWFLVRAITFDASILSQ